MDEAGDGGVHILLGNVVSCSSITPKQNAVKRRPRRHLRWNMRRNQPKNGYGNDFYLRLTEEYTCASSGIGSRRNPDSRSSLLPLRWWFCADLPRWAWTLVFSPPVRGSCKTPPTPQRLPPRGNCPAPALQRPKPRSMRR
ncbi:hypothetical protein SDC9_125159 [bioreactor metagenome]|uniref:Uncharacterized protein n=1 Tax=bioreactor metagenome TaxID=1076179 RepID=A0A645CMK5_9ZZZZ